MSNIFFDTWIKCNKFELEKSVAIGLAYWIFVGNQISLNMFIDRITSIL
jgi:hypothetical protein